MSRRVSYQVRGTHNLGGYFEATREKLWYARSDAERYFKEYRIYRLTEELIEPKPTRKGGKP